MTTVVSPSEFLDFLSIHKVDAIRWRAGAGWECQWRDPRPADVAQQEFDAWELGHPPRFTTDYGFWKSQPPTGGAGKKVKENSGQSELGL